MHPHEANPTLAPGALSQFRAFAAAQGVEIPSTAEADEVVQRMLVRQVAAVAFGREAYYRVLARLDPQVSAAAAAFEGAEAILALSKQP